MSCLAPCPACGRHIATDETACPFCAVALPASFRQACASRRPAPGRLSRVARLAVGAALIGVPASCAGSAYGMMGPYDAGVVDTGTINDGSNDADDASVAPLYGGAPAQQEQAPAQTDKSAPAPKPEKS